MIEAVIFDFDGLIVDTEWPAYEAWSTIYARYRQVLPLEKWVAAVGTFHGFNPVAYLNELTGLNLEFDQLFAEKELLKAAKCAVAPIMPGVEARIAEAKVLGAQTAVVSTSDREWVVTHLKRIGILDRFDAVITREDVVKVKPDPEPYLKAAARFDVSPSTCIVFEDSMNGVRAAKAAGMYCIAVPSRVTEFLDFGLADARVGSLEEFEIAKFANKIISLT
jgi:HAD superfamily hydrolase (TIGR01509 family)